MKASTRIVALLTATAVVASGCVTHRFFINLRSNQPLQYTVEGDSVDVVDGLVKLPRKDQWTQISRTSGESMGGEPSLQISYQARSKSEAIHPVGPPENPGKIQVYQGGSPLHRSFHVKAVFPSWQVKERYGDPDKYVKESLRESMENLESDSLSPEQEKEVWRAEVLAARDRYQRMLDDIVKPELERRGEFLDDESYAEDSGRFERKIRGLVNRADKAGKDSVDLDWYQDLRMPIAETAMEILGGTTAEWLPVADSLEQRYKSWLDLSDENVSLSMLFPGKFSTKVKPDTVLGDTLVWEFSAETLSDSTVVIQASSFEPRWSGVIILLILIEALVAILLHRRYHSKG